MGTLYTTDRDGNIIDLIGNLSQYPPLDHMADEAEAGYGLRTRTAAPAWEIAVSSHAFTQSEVA